MSTPVDPEEPVGVTLARMRRAKGLTGAQLAAAVGMSQPKISRIERGQGLPDPADVGVIARALDADEPAAHSLMQRAERSHDRMTDWRPTSAVLVRRQDSMAEWESAAEVVRDFQPALLAGLLQTSGYAGAVLAAFQRLQAGDEAPDESAVLAAVSARVRRQEVLADRATSFRFVFTEEVLRNPACSPAEMLAQLDHLRAVGARPNVTIGVIPDGVRPELPPLHGFTLFDESLVVIDVYNTGITSRGRGDVAAYRRAFDGFERSATAIEPLLDKYRTVYLDSLRGG